MARTHRLGDRSGPRFEVTFHPAAEKEFLELAPHVQDRFERAIDQAAIDPFRSRPGLDLRKLGDLDQGEALYRLRVGEYRCCYAVITSEKETSCCYSMSEGRATIGWSRRPRPGAGVGGHSFTDRPFSFRPSRSPAGVYRLSQVPLDDNERVGRATGASRDPAVATSRVGPPCLPFPEPVRGHGGVPLRRSRRATGPG